MSVISSTFQDGLISITGQLTSTDPINDYLIASIDTAGYNTISVQLTGVWVGSVIFQSSNDNATWVNTQGYAFNSTMSAVDTADNNDIYLLPVIGKYFQVVVGNLVGTVTATAYLRSQSMAGLGEALISQALDSTTNATLNVGFPNFVGAGQQAVTNSFPVALANEQILDKFISGAIFTGNVPVGTNLMLDESLLAQSYSAPIDCLQYRSIGVSIVQSAAVTAGAIAFEQSNDGKNFTSLSLFANTTTILGSTSTALILSTASSATTTYEGLITLRYVRFRVSTAIASTSTTIQVVTRLSMGMFARVGQSLSNIAQINNTVVPLGTSMTGSGAYGLNSPTLIIGGTDRSITRSELIGAPTTTVSNYTSGPYARSAYYDLAGAAGVAGVQPFLAEDKTYPVNVRLERATKAQESVQDLLKQVLNEIKALNYYIREMPNALSQNSFTSMSDESDNFYD